MQRASGCACGISLALRRVMTGVSPYELVLYSSREPLTHIRRNTPQACPGTSSGYSPKFMHVGAMALTADRRLRLVNDYADKLGYVSGFPTFQEADYGQG